MSRALAGYASVAVPVPVRRLFTYSVSETLAPRIGPGSRVRVPFGRRQVVGTVVEWPAAEPGEAIEIRPIDALLPGEERLPAQLLELTRFVADYYLCSWGEAIEAALPPSAGAPPVLRGVRRSARADPAGLPARAPALARLFEKLPVDGGAVALPGLDPRERRAALRLQRLGLAEIVELETPSAPEPLAEARAGAPPPHEPTPEQHSVLAELETALARREFAPFLLFGATGSGKTEVYLRAARQTLDRGQGVLYLVPEIGLTPLLVSRIESRFPGGIAVLHSGLTARQRSRAWEALRDGRLRFCVGTRSAIFAPIGELGLVVVDEEQDGSYKQEETPRYNARDVAVVRARAERAVLVLGSATPSLESFRHASSGRYRLLRLGGRVEQRPLPTVQIVDMRLEYRAAATITPLSRALVSELTETIARGEQALVLRNRRGWAAALFCPRCGHRVSCDNCSVTLTWHRALGRLCCHYCGMKRQLPERCPICRSEKLKLLGEGTEHIEDLLRQAVPGARIERMDRDTVRGRGAHERLLQRFERGEIDVLVGTQMIAKGHDFPNVTLVGILSADQALGLPDFRAAERTFQLLTQVAGRAGRGELPGTVVLQAFDAEHPLLRQAARQDFEAFYAREIQYRRAMRYPPMTALVQLIVHDPEAHRAREWGEKLRAALDHEGQGFMLIVGPGPAPLEKLKGRYRQQILARSAGRRRLIGAVERALAAVEGKIPRRAIQVDVDPQFLL